MFMLQVDISISLKAEINAEDLTSQQLHSTEIYSPYVHSFIRYVYIFSPVIRENVPHFL